LRASLDDFKRPWRERHRYDRESGEGYYRNAFDYDAVRRLLLKPADRVALCSRDRHLPAEMLYIAEVNPRVRADVVVDNTDLERPRLVRESGVVRGCSHGSG
jgi:uridine kinase